jgi:hypothetical protein
MRTTLRVSGETLVALVNLASLAVVIGTIVAVHAQSLRTGALIAATVYLSGVLGFGYSVWRLYRSRRPYTMDQGSHVRGLSSLKRASDHRASELPAGSALTTGSTGSRLHRGVFSQ